jgi:hypothetical protein
MRNYHGYSMVLLLGLLVSGRAEGAEHKRKSYSELSRSKLRELYDNNGARRLKAYRHNQGRADQLKRLTLEIYQDKIKRNGEKDFAQRANQVLVELPRRVVASVIKAKGLPDGMRMVDGRALFDEQPNLPRRRGKRASLLNKWKGLLDAIRLEISYDDPAAARRHGEIEKALVVKTDQKFEAEYRAIEKKISQLEQGQLIRPLIAELSKRATQLVSELDSTVPTSTVDNGGRKYHVIVRPAAWGKHDTMVSSVDARRFIQKAILATEIIASIGAKSSSAAVSRLNDWMAESKILLTPISLEPTIFDNFHDPIFAGDTTTVQMRQGTPGLLEQLSPFVSSGSMTKTLEHRNRDSVLHGQ